MILHSINVVGPSRSRGCCLQLGLFTRLKVIVERLKKSCRWSDSYSLGATAVVLLLCVNKVLLFASVVDVDAAPSH